VDNPDCPHCPGRRETVLHFLLECPHYARARDQLRHRTRGKSRRIEALLADPACVKPALTYINATGRFRKTHGDLTPPK
ncbi:hypothetical protein L210DRAFT_805538, partial [Boletus edulis BED1]